MDKLPETDSERLVRLIFGESQAEMPKKPRRPDVQGISELKLRLCDVLESLSERERRVLELRFGLGDGYSKTLEEVGKQFKVTRDRIRQIEAKALRKMRHPTRTRQLQEMIGNEE